MCDYDSKIKVFSLESSVEDFMLLAVTLLLKCCRFNVPAAVDVVRLFLPDLVVFTVSLLTMMINIGVVVKLKPGDGKRDSRVNGESTTEEDEPSEVEARHVPTDSERGTFSLCVRCVCVYKLTLLLCVVVISDQLISLC